MRRIEWLTSCKDRIPEGAALAMKLAAELAAELTLELAGGTLIHTHGLETTTLPTK